MGFSLTGLLFPAKKFCPKIALNILYSKLKKKNKEIAEHVNCSSNLNMAPMGQYIITISYNSLLQVPAKIPNSGENTTWFLYHYS